MALSKEDLLLQIESELNELNTSEHKDKKIQQKKLDSLQKMLKAQDLDSEKLAYINKEFERYQELKETKATLSAVSVNISAPN